MYTVIILSLMIASGWLLYLNRDKLKGIRSNITAIAWMAYDVFERVVIQLEMFPWRDYLTGNHALYTTLGTLALVTFFTTLKRTDK